MKYLVIILVLALGVTACGRRGDLEPPPSSEPAQ